MRGGLAISFGLLVASCGPTQWVDRVDMAKVPPSEQQAALQVRVFDQTAAPPADAKIVGEIRATSCKNKMWDPPATKGDALAQLRLKALRMGADAVAGVTYDERGTDTWGTNCWESVTVTGTALKTAS